MPLALSSGIRAWVALCNTMGNAEGGAVGIVVIVRAQEFHSEQAS
jgi:hypothetical protein